MRQLCFPMPLKPYSQALREYKDTLRADVEGHCDKEGWSKAQFADVLAGFLQDKSFTESRLNKIISTNENDMAYKLDAVEALYWDAITQTGAAFNENLDELGKIAMPEAHAEIAIHVLARHHHEERLASVLRRAM